MNFVLQGLAYARFQLTDKVTAAELAAAWTRNVEELCRVALMEFDDAEKLALRRWAGGGLVWQAENPHRSIVAQSHGILR